MHQRGTGPDGEHVGAALPGGHRGQSGAGRAPGGEVPAEVLPAEGLAVVGLAAGVGVERAVPQTVVAAQEDVALRGREAGEGRSVPVGQAAQFLPFHGAPGGEPSTEETVFPAAFRGAFPGVFRAADDEEVQSAGRIGHRRRQPGRPALRAEPFAGPFAAREAGVPELPGGAEGEELDLSAAPRGRSRGRARGRGRGQPVDVGRPRRGPGRAEVMPCAPRPVDHPEVEHPVPNGSVPGTDEEVEPAGPGGTGGDGRG